MEEPEGPHVGSVRGIAPADPEVVAAWLVSRDPEGHGVRASGKRSRCCQAKVRRRRDLLAGARRYADQRGRRRRIERDLAVDDRNRDDRVGEKPSHDARDPQLAEDRDPRRRILDRGVSQRPPMRSPPARRRWCCGT